MRLLSLALRRLAASIPTLMLILAGLFLLLQLAPGDTVDALMAQMGGGDAAEVGHVLDGPDGEAAVDEAVVHEHVGHPEQRDPQPLRATPRGTSEKNRPS